MIYNKIVEKNYLSPLKPRFFLGRSFELLQGLHIVNKTVQFNMLARTAAYEFKQPTKYMALYSSSMPQRTAYRLLNLQHPVNKSVPIVLNRMEGTITCGILSYFRVSKRRFSYYLRCKPQNMVQSFACYSLLNWHVWV